MIIAVIGRRNFSDYKPPESTLAVLPEITKIVSGGAKGADSLAEIYADKYQLPLVVFKPDWQKYGRGAGIVRNREIIEVADMVVASGMDHSKGTASCLEFAKSKGMPIQTVIF